MSQPCPYARARACAFYHIQIRARAFTQVSTLTGEKQPTLLKETTESPILSTAMFQPSTYWTT